MEKPTEFPKQWTTSRYVRGTYVLACFVWENGSRSSRTERNQSTRICCVHTCTFYSPKQKDESEWKDTELLVTIHFFPSLAIQIKAYIGNTIFSDHRDVCRFCNVTSFSIFVGDLHRMSFHSIPIT